MKIGLFYGSTTGNTEDIALQIQTLLAGHEVELHDLADESVESMNDYTQLIMGIPTWDYGELQEDWLEVWEELEELDLTGKTVALFGLGDQLGYGEWFQDAMGLLHDQLKKQGAQLIGYWPNQGYDFDSSKALTADKSQFVGLALDEDGQHVETEARLQTWIKQIIDEYQ